MSTVRSLDEIRYPDIDLSPTKESKENRNFSITNFPTAVISLFTAVSLMVALCIYEKSEVLGLAPSLEQKQQKILQKRHEIEENVDYMLQLMRRSLLTGKKGADEVEQIKMALDNIEAMEKGKALHFFLSQPDLKIMTANNHVFELIIVAYIKDYSKNVSGREVLYKLLPLLDNFESTDPLIKALKEIHHLDLSETLKDFKTTNGATVSAPEVKRFMIYQFLPEIVEGSMTPEQVLRGYLFNQWNTQPQNRTEKDPKAKQGSNSFYVEPKIIA